MRSFLIGAGMKQLKGISTATRKALLITSGILAVCWILQIWNSADHYRITVEFGLRPRTMASLPNVVLSCFVHLSWSHLIGNSVFIFVFGYLAAYQGIRKFIGVTALVMVTSNLPWWLFGPGGSYSAGASGMIWGWVGYSLTRGIFHHKELDRDVITRLVLLYSITALDLLFPGPAEWQAHIAGLVSGVACGLSLRNHPASLAVGASQPADMATEAWGPRVTAGQDPRLVRKSTLTQLLSIILSINSEGRQSTSGDGLEEPAGWRRSHGNKQTGRTASC